MSLFRRSSARFEWICDVLGGINRKYCGLKGRFFGFFACLYREFAKNFGFVNENLGKESSMLALRLLKGCEKSCGLFEERKIEAEAAAAAKKKEKYSLFS